MIMKRSAVIFKKCLVVAVLFALLIGGGYFYYYRTYYEWALEFGLIEPTKQPSPITQNASFEDRLIAHGAGKVRWQTKTDSKEAFLNAIAEGFRFIEIDLRKTLDGHYFAAHRYDEFEEITGRTGMGLIPPTAKDVRSRKILNQYTPLFLTDIAVILKEHPDVFLVTDKARDFDLLLKEFPFPDRMIVEVSSLGQYYAALRAGIRYPALNKLNSESVDRFGVNMLVINPRILKIHEKKISQYIKNGVCVLVASYPSSQDIPKKHRLLPNMLFYVDRW